MIKIIGLVLFFLSIAFANPANAKVHVEYVANQTHGLLMFIDAISGSTRLPPDIKKAFKESKYNNAESKAKIDMFINLDTAFDRFIAISGGPKERFADTSIRDFVLVQSAFAKDLKDFRERLLETMTYDELNRLFEVLEYFNPIYNELIWKKNHKDLLKILEAFKSNSKKWKMDQLFDKASKFYNSSWPEQQSFRISIYPVPKGARLSTATSVGAIESMAVIIGDTRAEGHFGVAFHELCHSLYSAQSIEVQKQWSDWFLNNPSPYAGLAYQLINEALATALGNGWAYEKAKGKMDKKEWYNNKQINDFALALYPKVLEYVNADRSVDKDFIDHAVKTYEQIFPQALAELDNLLFDYYLLSDGTFPVKDFRKSLREKFNSQSITASNPIDDGASKVIQDKKTSTVFLVATHKNKKQIFSLENNFPGIEKIVKKAKSNDNQIGLFTLNGRRVLILLITHPDQLEKISDWMGKNRGFEKQNEFVATP